MNALEIFNRAYQDYVHQDEREGYVSGWLTKLRHSRKMYPHIEELFTKLNGAANSEIEISIFKEFLSSPKTKFNNHSFSIYLLKYLEKELPIPDTNWEDYYPKSKQIVFYNSDSVNNQYLYRGTLQPPESALKDGITSDTSKQVEEFAAHTNMSIGISTSKNKNIAQRYSSTSIQTPRGAIFIRGNVYQINYRGIGAIDINETLKKRSDTLTLTIGQDKEEVNIIDKIPPEDIVGYWDQSGVWHDNTRYVPNKPLPNKLSFFDRLTLLFQINKDKKVDILLTDEQIKKTLSNPVLRKLYDYLLSSTGERNDPKYSSALKLFLMINGQLEQKTFTEAERFALLEGKLGEITIGLQSLGQIPEQLALNTYRAKLSGPLATFADNICNLVEKTSEYKREKLYDLLDRLVEFQKADEFDLEKFTQLDVHCVGLLLDRKFAYKRINPLGLLNSRSSNTTSELRDFLKTHIPEFIADKLSKKVVDKSQAKEFYQAIHRKDYVTAIAKLDAFSDSPTKDAAKEYFKELIDRKSQLTPKT